MPMSTTCGHCGRLVHVSAVSALHIAAVPMSSPSTAYMEAAFKCPNCLRLSVASERRHDLGSSSSVVNHGGAADDAPWREPAWLPRLREVREFDDVPEHIGQAASEATLCLSVGAYRAVGSLARAVIEATAKDKGAGGGSLAGRIDALRNADHVREHTKEQAHEVRHFGNDMAHGDFVDPVTREEAEEVIELLAEILDEVYQSPARLQKRKLARLAKKTEGA